MCESNKSGIRTCDNIKLQGDEKKNVRSTSQIGILVPRRDQSRADGAVGTGESLRSPIASPYLNTLLIFILSDT